VLILRKGDWLTKVNGSSDPDSMDKELETATVVALHFRRVRRARRRRRSSARGSGDEVYK
jgi:hypothetical protein